jgi:hypothetical protein
VRLGVRHDGAPAFEAVRGVVARDPGENPAQQPTLDGLRGIVRHEEHPQATGPLAYRDPTIGGPSGTQVLHGQAGPIGQFRETEPGRAQRTTAHPGLLPVE